MSIRAEFRIVISLRFPHKTDVRFVFTSGQLFLGGLMPYLRYLCLFTYSGVQHILCYVFLRLVYPMLPVSLDCFCYVFLRLVYPMLPVSLDCPFLFATSVFSNVYFHINDSIDTNHMRNEIKNNIHVLNILSLNYLM